MSFLTLIPGLSAPALVFIVSLLVKLDSESRTGWELRMLPRIMTGGDEFSGFRSPAHLSLLLCVVWGEFSLPRFFSVERPMLIWVRDSNAAVGMTPWDDALDGVKGVYPSPKANGSASSWNPSLCPHWIPEMTLKLTHFSQLSGNEIQMFVDHDCIL